MEESLGSMVGRAVDLVERGPVERSCNWMRTRQILGSAERVFPALDLVRTDERFAAARANGDLQILEQRDSSYRSRDIERQHATRTRANLLDAITFSDEVIRITTGLGYG